MTDINTTIEMQIEQNEKTHETQSFLIINGKGWDGYERVNDTWKININKLVELGIAERIW